MDLRGLAAVAARILELLSLSQQNSEASEHAENPPDFANDSAKKVPPRIDHDASDLFGLARLLDRRREPASARHHYKAALVAGLPPALARTARRELARLSKRAGDHADAVEHWESLLDFRGSARKPEKAARELQIASRVNVTEFPATQSLTLERILLRGALGLPHGSRPRNGSRGRDATSENLREMLEACEQLAIHFEHRAKNLDRAFQLTNHALSLLSRGGSNGRLRGVDGAESFTVRMESRFSRRMARLERKIGR
jgi:tetratricopeptide (TPR) repeat protein